MRFLTRNWCLCPPSHALAPPISQFGSVFASFELASNCLNSCFQTFDTAVRKIFVSNGFQAAPRLPIFYNEVDSIHILAIGAVFHKGKDLWIFSVLNFMTDVGRCVSIDKKSAKKRRHRSGSWNQMMGVCASWSGDLIQMCLKNPKT